MPYKGLKNTNIQKLSFGLLLMGGTILLLSPGIRKSVRTLKHNLDSKSDREYNVVMQPPANEEVSVIQTRVHPGI